jgi:hypothetical protein
MFAARPLHPAKADMPGSPSDVAEGPIADLARQSISLAHEDNRQLLRVAQWVVCGPCGLERIG